MAEYEELTASIAETVADYRRDTPSIGPMSERVKSWIGQFGSDVQLPILQEMNYVLKKTYFSQERIMQFLNDFFDIEKPAGCSPCSFWKSKQFLRIQTRGGSQKNMLAMFDRVLSKKCDFKTPDCGNDSSDFIYLDDAIFTGNSVFHFLKRWLEGDGSPEESKVLIVTAVSHTAAEPYAKRRIEDAARNVGKGIDIRWHNGVRFQNKEDRTRDSDVLWPTSAPEDDEVNAYIEKNIRRSLRYRSGWDVGENRIFQDAFRRNILEQEFLKAGVRILKEGGGNRVKYDRPLGNVVLEKLGFGSLVATFRNCPNNAPLVLWSGRHPLFPRLSNNEEATWAAILEEGDSFNVPI